jgi:pimeloyl-ACP methyl ester carboxylesterase
MPFVERGEARIFWNAIGEGEPVVLVMGLGCSSAAWFRVAPKLARRHRVILLDNRGAGQTTVRHYVVHRVSSMAADIAAVLDAAGEASAHIVGFSMGGMISQQFAIDFPRRVRSLALLGTHPGGVWAVQAHPSVRDLLFAKGDTPVAQSMAEMRAYTYARETPDELFDEDVVVRAANAPTKRGLQAQLLALIGWSAYLDLPRLRCPTLILHGLQDALIPPANGRLLASRIPGSALIEYPQASHWLTTDQNARCVDALLDHLHAHRQTGQASPSYTLIP